MIKRLGSATLAVFCAIGAAQGAQTVWNTAASGDWNVAGNWSSGIPDDATEDAVIGTAGDYTVSLTGAMYPVLTNLTLTVTNTNARLDVAGVDYRLAAGVVTNEFVLRGGAGGTGTVTWATGGIDTGNGVEANRGDILVEQGASLYTTNTTILCRNLYVRTGATLTLGGPSNPALTVRNGGTGYIYLHHGGVIRCGPGTITIRNSQVRMENNSTNFGRSTLILEGATLNATVSMANISSGLGSLFEIRSGSGSFSSVTIGRTATAGGILDEMKVSGGNTTCSGSIQVGNAGSSDKAHGIYTQTGGQLSCMTTFVGAHAPPNGGGGYFNLSGGTNTVKVLQLYTDDTATNANNFGTRQFVVGTNAVMRFNGAGMQATGTNGWLMNFSAATNDFGTPGAIVYDPSGVSTQTLLAFARDEGQDFSMMTSNTAIGTLDLTGLDGVEKLVVQAASNETVNAVYVDNLVGLSDTEAAAHVDSALNIYYNKLKSVEMNRMRISLAGGGALIPLPKIPPGTIIKIY